MQVSPINGELVVNKQCVNPFFNTGLHAWLARHAVRELVLCGVATNLVVTVLEGCCASVSEEMHQFAVSKMLPMFGRVTTSADYLKEIQAGP